MPNGHGFETKTHFYINFVDSRALPSIAQSTVISYVIGLDDVTRCGVHNQQYGRKCMKREVEKLANQQRTQPAKRH